MLLPCPHCRRQFNLDAERIPPARARLECPACGGVFVFDPTGPSKQPSSGQPPKDSAPSVGMENSPRRYGRDVSRPGFLLFWTLVPTCCLLLALAGILLSGPWGPAQGPALHSLPSGGEPGQSLSSSVSSLPETPRKPGASPVESNAPTVSPEPPAESLLVRAFWSPESDVRTACGLLPRPPTDPRDTGDQDACETYPAWISYLILETAPTPVCGLEPTFEFAADGLQKESLCGPGLAFLSAYYLKKGLLDRSQSFLDQALGQDPENPWVRLVEAVFFEQAYYDDQKVIRILEDVGLQDPSFSLSRYVLGKAYVREEDYGKANTAFASLKEDAKGQIAFWRIRRALSSLETAADRGEEKAEALLALSRTFASLKDYTMAQDLYRWILDDMSERLPREEQRAAFCELGGIYEMKGDNSSAYNAYRSALEIDPEFPTARERIRVLMSSQSDRS